VSALNRFEKKSLILASEVATRTEVVVRFQDVDAAGIVFFARIFDYVHVAYEEFLSAVGHPLPKVLAERAWAAPLRHAEADYLEPCRFGDRLTVELVAAVVEESEISLGWRLSGPGAADRPKAVAQTVHTFVALPAFSRCPVPAEIAEKLAQLA